jgi:iron complex outermembrane receptor protein
MDASFNYSCAVKYHLNKDFSLGLRGENLFNDSFEQAYRGYKRAIAVTDQKVWFNMEYLF